MNDYNRHEELNFQFVLYINDNIICQRYFNVSDFNEKSLKSLELKELMLNITGMNNGKLGSLGIIPKFLQKKALTYLWDSYNPYIQQTEENIRTVVDKKDVFQFEIKMDEKVVAKSQFSGSYFPPKIRYAVDVREIIPEIINEIKTYFSLEKYNIDVKTKSWEKSQKEFLVK